MGWDSCTAWHKKSDVVADLTRQIENRGANIILAKKSTADGVWYVIEQKEDKTRFIYFGLIKKSGGQWSLKTMSESMGPAYYSCPVSFFALVPCPEGYAVKWRKSVLERSNRPKRSLVAGTTVRLYGKSYDVLERNGKLVFHRENVYYKVSRKNLQDWREAL